MSNEKKQTISVCVWFFLSVITFLVNLVFGFSFITTCMSLYTTIMFGLKMRDIFRPTSG